MSNTIKVLLVDNDGSGFANHVEIDEGLTVAQFVALRRPDEDPSSFLVRVNREEVAGDYVLSPSDKVTLTPRNIEGA